MKTGTKLTNNELYERDLVKKWYTAQAYVWLPFKEFKACVNKYGQRFIAAIITVQ